MKRSHPPAVPSERSPFFRPSAPDGNVELLPVTSPGGTTIRAEQRISPDNDVENKSTILGTVFNFVNQIVGAGIVGIPFAIKESGLIAGIFLIVLSAVLTEKSLRLLLETAEYLSVPSYEMLCEASFGRTGFLLVSLAMFVLSFGSMVGYLMVVKDTLPPLLGIAPDEAFLQKIILAASSLIIMVPISSQRDMADLAKTSTVSVIFDVIIVAVVVANAPISLSIDEWGWREAITFVRPNTVFVGLGVLSFAFVCQHSGFIIAGALRSPTPRRLRTVTSTALGMCATLATIIGVTGYLGFLEETEGNILNNLDDKSVAANVARALLCTCMFFVYPMESFVARHVSIVLLFEGRSAHKGDDHTVLARTDRRILLTLALYLLALVPAIIFEDLGKVLALTGAVGGSSLSYIGPGIVFLGVHGATFLDLVEDKWGWKRGMEQDRGQLRLILSNGEERGAAQQSICSGGKTVYRYLSTLIKSITWYALLMPLWCSIASTGEQCLTAFEEDEATKSPHPRGRPWKRQTLSAGTNQKKAIPQNSEKGEGEDKRLLLRTLSLDATWPKEQGVQKLRPISYGTPTTNGLVGNRAIASTIAAMNKQGEGLAYGDSEDQQSNTPTWNDFLVAIGLFIFGFIAITAGVWSIFS